MNNRSLQGKRIALIGGAGFIGHHLAIALVSQGANVDVVDGLQVNNLLTFASKNSPANALYSKFILERLSLLHAANIPVHILDARDYHALSHLLDRLKPQVVIHLAAIAHAGTSNKDPFSTFDHSLRTLENALDNARSGIEHFIYFSSSMVYGNFASESVTEESACEPLGIYGALKFSGEKIVIAYHQVFGLPYTIIRPSALYGERCVSRRVSQIFIENALQGLEVEVRGDGSDRLDFTYIEDLTDGVTKIIQNEKSKNQIFNITFGQSRSIGDLLELVVKEFPDLKIRFLPKDELMPQRGTLSVAKAKAILGFQPQNPLEKGMAKYIRWYRDFLCQEGKEDVLVSLP